MNPFNDDSESDDNSDSGHEIIQNNIEIRFEQRGKRKNTYMTGWGLDLPTQKNHLKVLRNKLSCSGSCKKKKIDNTEKLVFHLQGDHVETLKKYLLNQGVKNDDIKIKGR